MLRSVTATESHTKWQLGSKTVENVSFYTTSRYTKTFIYWCYET